MNISGNRKGQIAEIDTFSFADSERFDEEEDVCSDIQASEAGSLNHRWRGWAGNCVKDGLLSLNINELQNESEDYAFASCGNKVNSNNISSLTELSAKKVAKTFSFEAIEFIYGNLRPSRHFPEGIMLLIVKNCFPDFTDNIRLYSCLANGNPTQYSAGEELFLANSVSDVFQIGYHLSAVVDNKFDQRILNISHESDYIRTTSSFGFNNFHREYVLKQKYDVSLRVDRCRIVSCHCSCSNSSIWCRHVVATCLYRIRHPELVKYRTAIWDSIAGLEEIQLKKFAQYLINDLPLTYIPVAQKLIDDLRNPKSHINLSFGAPDPTAGCEDLIPVWCMDESILHENIRRILLSFVKPAPTVYCDVQTLSSASPAVSYDWTTLISSHCSKEPEALWNLLSIVREMLKRGDSNASLLLHAITDQVLSIDFILIRWYQISLTKSGNWLLIGGGKSGNNQVIARQYSANSLCDEIVKLWRLISLDPRLSNVEREQLTILIQRYHRTAVHRIWTILGGITQDNHLSINIINKYGTKLSQQNAAFSQREFPGFFLSLQSCYINWSDFFSYFSTIDQHLSKCLFNQFSLPSNLSIFCQKTGPLHLIEMINVEQVQSGSVVNSKSKKKSKKKKKKYIKPSSYKTKDVEKEKKKIERERIFVEQSEDSTLDGESIYQSVGTGSFQEDNGIQLGTSFNRKISCGNDKGLFEDELDELLAYAHSEINSFHLKFTYCEALHSHGFLRAAFFLAKELAKELYDSCSLLIFEDCHNDFVEDSDSEVFDQPLLINPCSSNSKQIQNISIEHNSLGKNSIEFKFFPPHTNTIESTVKIETILSNTFYICKILVNPNNHIYIKNNHSLVLQLALEVMRMHRGPSATKWHEVYIHYLECEIFELLHQVDIGVEELLLIRSFAHDQLDKMQNLAMNKVTVPPTKFAHYILNALSYTYHATNVHSPRKILPQSVSNLANYRKPSDDQLVLDLCLKVLEMRVYISETDHPMLCECIRRQRRELQLTLLLRNRDSTEKIALVLDRTLDNTVHKMYETHLSNAAFFFEFNLSNKHLSDQVSFHESMPPYVANQATEAQAFFMFEFAKRVLADAGGNQNTSMFNPMQQQLVNGVLPGGLAVGIANNYGPHRNLHICSFLIGLYALGLSNQVSSTWQTRTYSAHVSWVHCQALEIGKQALEIIRLTWKKHLTPTEVASLADRASQSSDPMIIDESALLALSILPNAYALTAVESQKALNQCKERSSKLLEDACLAVEKAAEKNGVYPEVLFKVAHHWYDLYCESGNQPQQTHLSDAFSTRNLTAQQTTMYTSIQSVPTIPLPMVAISSIIPQYALPPPTHLMQVQNAQQSQQHSLDISRLIVLPPPATQPYIQQGPPPTQANKLNCSMIDASSGSSGVVQIHQQHFSSHVPLMPITSQPPPQILPPMSRISNMHHIYQPMPQSQHNPKNYIPNSHIGAANILNNYHRHSHKGFRFLKNAHRVGMSAMNTMSTRSSEDNRNFKWSKNPGFSDEIQWLLEVSIEIGEQEYVRSFCEKVITCMASPFVLIDLLKDSISFFQHFRRNHQSHVSQHSNEAATATIPINNYSKSNSFHAKNIMFQNGHSSAVVELMRHCVEMCYNAAYNKLNYANFGELDLDYVCDLAIVAKEVFSYLVPYQKSFFDSFLRYMKKQKACKRDFVYQSILNSIRTRSPNFTDGRPTCFDGL